MTEGRKGKKWYDYTVTKQETIPSGVLGNEVNIEGKGGSGTNNIKVIKISGNHLFTKNYMQCI